MADQVGQDMPNGLAEPPFPRHWGRWRAIPTLFVVSLLIIERHCDLIDRTDPGYAVDHALHLYQG